jgi:predicted peptidase
VDADVIVATDPDSDRAGVTIKASNGEYITLTGNQIGVLLCEFILRNKKKNGTLPSNGAVIKTIVTTDMVAPIADEYGVNKDAISLCGISMGGFGTWEIALQVPEKFSAIAPICGGGMNWRAWYLRNTPIRVFHGKLDDIVPISQSEAMVNSIKLQGGNIEFTVYDDLGHCCWDRAFEQTDLVSWLANARK